MIYTVDVHWIQSFAIEAVLLSYQFIGGIMVLKWVVMKKKWKQYPKNSSSWWHDIDQQVIAQTGLKLLCGRYYQHKGFMQCGGWIPLRLCDADFKFILQNHSACKCDHGFNFWNICVLFGLVTHYPESCLFEKKLTN